MRKMFPKILTLKEAAGAAQKNSSTEQKTLPLSSQIGTLSAVPERPTQSELTTMKGCPLLCCLLLVPVLFATEYNASADVKHPDPVIARKLNLTVQELHSLRERFGLDNDQLLALPRIEFAEMLDEISHPGIDKHAAEQEFQAEKLRDENGQIPPDGL